MPKYLTSYKVNRATYGSHIYARSFKAAEIMASKRNIGEKIIGVSSGVIRYGNGRRVTEEIANPLFRKVSDYDFIKQLPHIIHTACFLGYISSHCAEEIDILSDQGVLHDLIHLMVVEDTNARMIKSVRERFYELQKIIPGYLPLRKK